MFSKFIAVVLVALTLTGSYMSLKVTPGFDFTRLPSTLELPGFFFILCWVGISFVSLCIAVQLIRE